MAKKVYLITRRGLAYRVSTSPPVEGEHGIEFESENGIAYDDRRIQGGGVVDPYSLLEPISYIKAIPNEYNSGNGLAAKEVGFVATGIAYDDVTDGSFCAAVPHYAKSAGIGEWSTGGTVTFKALCIWIDNSGNLQTTTMVAKDGGPSATGNAFTDVFLYGPAIRPKVGSRWFIHGKCVFSVDGYYSHGRADYANGEALQYGSSVPDPTTTPYSNTYAGAGDYYGPSFVGGNLLRPTGRVSGDSNTSGVLTSAVADVPDTLHGGIGAANRLLTPNMAVIDVSIPGGTALENADPAKNVCTDRLMKMGKANKKKLYVIGFNDILNNGRSSTQVRDDIATQAARHGEGEVWIGTMLPKVTSQSANTIPNSAAEAVRQAENTRRKALANVIDFATGVEQGAAGTLQRLSDTLDGTHLNTEGNKASVAGSGFDVAVRMGVDAVSAGFKYAAGALYQSLRFDTGWTAQQTALTLKQAYSPEHQVTAALVTEDASTNNHAIFSQQTIALVSTTKKVTAFIKRGSGSRNAKIQIQQNGGSYQSSAAVINLATGALIFKEDTAGTVSGYTSALTEDGFWKVEFSIAFGASHPAGSFFYVKMADAAGNDNYAGDNASSIAVWGFDIR